MFQSVFRGGCPASGGGPLISLRPALHAFGRIFGAPTCELEAIAVDRWQIAPGERRVVRPARMLPGQIDRIRGTEFGSPATVRRDFLGDFETDEGPTLGFRLRDVDLLDGVLYGPGAHLHLRHRERRLPIYRAPAEVARGTLYESWVGNRWFGNWLSDDCLAYPLAAGHGEIVTTRPAAGHVPDYEARLGMTPRRMNRVHFDELVIFNDHANNSHRQARATAMRDRLVAGADIASHPGVYLVRGTTGDPRLLVNEREIADRLQRERGFVVLDPSSASVEEIVRVCGGARVIAGIEGSQMAHGMMLMPADATFFAIFPPDRVVSVMKIPVDRQGQTFAAVIGEGVAERFTVSWDEVNATLDLL